MAAPKFKRKKFTRAPKFKLPSDFQADYKDTAMLLKFITDRGKIMSRRLTGVTASAQRDITTAIKRARYLGLLTVGSAKR